MLNYLICPRANKRCKVTTFFSNGNDFQKKNSIREINAPGKALPYILPWSVYYNTPRFSDRHTDGGMKKKRYLCGKEENQNGKTIEIHSSIQGQGSRVSTQGNRTAGVAGQKAWRGTLENHGMEERTA